MATRDNEMLTLRRRRILGAIVQEHVETAAPVGSKVVQERYGVRSSTATIRSEMGVLEREGFVEQPHTSAGRIPKDKGYRTYVDRLMPDAMPTPGHLAWIRSEYRRAADDAERVYRTTSRVLSQLTSAPAVVMAPPDEPMILADIKLVPTSAHVVRLQYETQPGGRFECLLLPVQALSAEQVQALGQALARRFCGRAMGALSLCSPESLEDEMPDHTVPKALLDEVKTAVERDRMQRVYVDGSAYALNYPEYQEIEKLRPVVEALDEEAVMRRLLRPASRSARVSVTIGSEQQIASLRGSSLVAIHYRGRGGEVGALGVLGPTRLNYQMVIAAVRCVAEHVAAAFATD